MICLCSDLVELSPRHAHWRQSRKWQGRRRNTAPDNGLALRRLRRLGLRFAPLRRTSLTLSR
jgi:hypothetical protein